LLDLARHFFGPEGVGTHQLTDADLPGGNGRSRYEAGQTTNDPEKLFDWTLFHEQVGTLPERAQEVFRLHWYYELKFVQIAELLGIDRKEVSKLWGSAQEALAVAMHGEVPGRMVARKNTHGRRDGD
jgi:RNA polymerase sigma factor (sigma-70 family)